MEQQEIVKGASLWRDAWKRLLKNKLAVFGLIVVALMVVAVIVGPFIIRITTGYTYDFIPPEKELIKSFPPSFKHPMGTDDQGRDILARVLQGGRISLMVGIISTVVSLIVGVSYGATAGYLGGRIDNFMMRVVDIIYAIPYILLVIVLLAAFGGQNSGALVAALPVILTTLITLLLIGLLLVSGFRSMFQRPDTAGDGSRLPGKIVFGVVSLVALALGVGLNVLFYRWFLSDFGAWLGEAYTSNVNQGLSQIFLLFFALGLVSWLTMARVVRGQILSLKNQEFVLAARATGVSTPAIIFRHLVPNALGPVIVYATLTIPSVMLSEAFLSFLGIGVQAPFASWGSLAADGIKNISIFPWQLIFPGVTMALTLFSLNFLGDGLRDALDPQTRKF
jgi:ABC-type dipeptide/oligopeptide/nickel transport system permease subunit